MDSESSFAADGTSKNGKSPVVLEGRPRRARKTTLENLAAKNQAHRAKITTTKTRAKASTSAATTAPASSSPTKRKGAHSEDRSKRQRQQYQPFQHLSSTPQPGTSTAKAAKEKPVIIYSRGDFLAIRNEANNFFICRARQNIYKNGNRIKISWYNDDHSPGIYGPDFDDDIDFETILTNVKVNKIEPGKVQLPDSENQRVHNILQRAINVEQGIHERPDPTKVFSDGLDISIIGQIEEDELLKRMKKELNGKKRTPKAGRASANGAAASSSNGVQAPETSTPTVKAKREAKSESVKQSAVSSRREKVEKTEKESPDKSATNGRPRTRKISPATSDLGKVSPQMDLTTFKFEDSRVGSSSSFDSASEEKADLMFETRAELPFISSYVNSKLLIRAVRLKDQQMLKQLLKNEQQHLCSVTIPQSVCIKRNALHVALANEDFISLNRILMLDQKALAATSYHIHSMELHHSELILDQAAYQTAASTTQLDGRYAKFALKSELSLDFIKKVTPHFVNGLADFTDNLLAAIKCGNSQLAHFLAQEACQSNPAAFNASHLMLLGTDFTAELPDSALNELSISSHRINALHTAAINPDPYFFSSIVANSLDKLYSVDSHGWAPIHFASVSSTFFNLQYLLQLGVSTLNVDAKGNTPLHLAVRYDRLENVALILSTELAHSTSSASLRAFNAKGWTPLHIACKRGFTSVAKFLLENEAEVDIATSNCSGEQTPLMIACQYGHLKIAKLLIDHGANLNLFDKKSRCPLTYAVMNGHSVIVNNLLNYAANPSCKDMFGNNLFHYALAYGWYYCYEILLKTNINLKDTNMFGLTPIGAAFMKGHIGIIDDILRRNILSVNVPVNDCGITLVMLTFSLYPNETLITHLRLFIERFKCDLTKTDYNGNSVLHYLLQCESKYRSNSADQSAIRRVLHQALTMLAEVCPYTANNAGICPIMYALKNDCITSFLFFFKEHHKSPRFLQLITGSEHFWPLILTHLLDPMVPGDYSETVGQYIQQLAKRDKAVQTTLTSMNLKANKNGDVAIQFFVKSSKQIAASARGHMKPELIEWQMNDFMDYLLHFYELKLLQDFHLLHVSCQYSSAGVVRHLSSKFFPLESRDEERRTPMQVALEHQNIDAARVLIESGANCHAKIGHNSVFIFSLKHVKYTYEFAMFMSRLKINVLEKDKDENTALHLIAGNINVPYSEDIVRFLVEHEPAGTDVNLQNKHGQTCLHIALHSNTISAQLIAIFELLLQNNRANLYLKDLKGFTALNYLIQRNGAHEDLVALVQLIDTKVYDLNHFVDASGATLLHSCAALGNSSCLSYLKAYVEVNKANHRGITPLAAATINGHKDCALILLQSGADVFHKVEFTLEDGQKVNLYSLMEKNGWNDLLYEILAQAKAANQLLDFLYSLIRLRCITFATSALKIAKCQLPLQRDDMKNLLREFSKNATSVLEKAVQLDFLGQIPADLFKECHLEVFLSSVGNWNHVLCQEVLRRVKVAGILSEMQAEKKAGTNLISLVFLKLFNEEHFVEEMKQLVELFIAEEVNINTLACYSIMESGQQVVRYTNLKDANSLFISLVQYSPLIVAIIKGNYDLVRWLLNITHNGQYVVDVNFPDSNQRTPLMHAVLKNDLKMVKLLLDRGYNPQADTDCWTTTEKEQSFSNANEADLLVRDKNKLTLFHYLILPFDYFNYAKGDVIFSFLWQLVEANHKTADLVSELYKLAADSHVANIVTLLERIESRRIAARPVVKKTATSRTRVHSFLSDHENLMTQLQRSQRTDRYYDDYWPVLKDDASSLPFDATFTKLDSQKGHYIYNFYKLQIQMITDRPVLVIRWGRVGTKGNLKKIYFPKKQDAIEEFKRLFALKSGNEWSSVDGSEHRRQVEQDQYRILEPIKRSITMMSFDLDKNFDQLITIKSDLSIDLRDIIIRWMKCLAKCVETTRMSTSLNSLLLEHCEEILQKIYPHIFKRKVSMAGSSSSKKCGLKYMNDIIDLSEEFFSLIGIYGKELDQLQPIMNLSDFYDKAKHLHRLKSTNFAKELIFCAQQVKDLNPVDYIYDSFHYEMESVLPDCEEWKFVHLYLKSSAAFPFKTVSFYRVKLAAELFETSRNSHLLWYPLDDPYILSTFTKGLQLEPMNDPNSHLIFKGLKLTNRLVNESPDPDKLHYVILCEAKLDRVLSLATNEAIDHCSFEQNSALVVLPTGTTSDYVQDYISWKGYTVPFPTTHRGPSDFIMLSLKHVVPRYVIEYRKIH